jgi:hypothetical protein
MMASLDELTAADRIDREDETVATATDRVDEA